MKTILLSSRESKFLFKVRSPKCKKIVLLLSAVLLIWFCFCGGSAYATPDNKFQVWYFYDEATGGPWDFIREYTAYAAAGYPPMLDIKGYLKHNYGYGTEQVAGAVWSWQSIIAAPAGYPEGFSGLVPYNVRISVNGTAQNAWLDASASVGTDAGSGVSTGIIRQDWDQPIEYSQTLSGTAPVGHVLTTTLGAGVHFYVYGTGPLSAEGEIVIDPYIYIDQSWQYASYFKVLQAPGPNDNGVWQETFDPNASAVPDPETIWLLGSGLIGVVGLKRKFVKHYCTVVSHGDTEFERQGQKASRYLHNAGIE
jgi:hypothetical protein